MSFLLSNIIFLINDKVVERCWDLDFLQIHYDTINLLFTFYHPLLRTQINKVFNYFSTFEDFKLRILQFVISEHSLRLIQGQNNNFEKLKTSNNNDENSNNNINIKTKNYVNELSELDELDQSDRLCNLKLKKLYYSKLTIKSEINSKPFYENLIKSLKDRIIQLFEKLILQSKSLSETKKIQELHNRVLNNICTYDADKEKYIDKSVDEYLTNDTIDVIKLTYNKILKQFICLIESLTNLIINDFFDEYSYELLIKDKFINKIKDILLFFQNNDHMHKDLDSKSNFSLQNELKNCVNEIFLLLFLIFPDAKIDFIGEKSNQYYKEENKNLSILSRLFDLLKNNKENSNLVSKILFTINRFIANNNIFSNFNNILTNIINELSVLIKQSQFDFEILKDSNNKNINIGNINLNVLREVYRILYTIQTKKNNYKLFLKADKIKVQKDFSGKNDLMLIFKNKSHLDFNLNNLSNKIEEFTTTKENYNDFFEIINSKTLRGEKKISSNNNFILDKFFDFNDSLSINELYNDHINRIISNQMMKEIDNKSTIMSKSECIVDKEYNYKNEKIENYKEFYEYLSKTNNYYDYFPEMVIKLPFKKIMAYKDEKGVIFHSTHSIMFKNNLELGKNFTISIRFYNPFPDTGNFHTLLQNNEGFGGIIVVDKNSERIGCFTEDGIWIDLGINLKSTLSLNKWNYLAITYSEFNESTNLNVYHNGLFVKQFSKERLKLPNNIAYIGNSKDFTEPFGIWSDLKIFNIVLTKEGIDEDFNSNKLEEVNYFTNFNEKTFFILSNQLNYITTHSDRLKENTLSKVKLINSYLNSYSGIKHFGKINFLIKIVSLLVNNEDEEIINEVSKFIYNLS